MPRSGSTVARGYGAAHKRERRRLEPIVQRGEAYCQQGIPGNGSSGTCLHRTRWIKPGTRWALGHTDDRTAWIGPVHYDCNQRDGATRGGKAIAAKHRRANHTTTTAQPIRPRGW